MSKTIPPITPGFYWVMFADSNPQFEVAERTSDGLWNRAGSDEIFEDIQLDDWDDEPLTRKEKRMKEGFYWCRFGGEKDLTVGFYEPLNSVGEKCRFPWTIVGSDEIFTEDQIVVVASLTKPVT